MKTFTLILLAALCGTAAADPERRIPYDHPTERAYDHDRRGEWHHHNGEWTQLMSSTRARGQEFVNVDTGPISQLRIVADDGRVYVRNVMVVYRDGTKRWYRVDRTLRREGDASATIQLDYDRPVARLAVNARGYRNAYFSVYGA